MRLWMQLEHLVRSRMPVHALTDCGTNRDGTTRRNRSIACVSLLCFLFVACVLFALCSLLMLAPIRCAQADEAVQIEVSQLTKNPYSHSGASSFIRVEGPTSSIAYCAQGNLITPKEGQTLERYGSLEIPELDYVMYHGYDGEMTTSLDGLDEQKSEAATAAAVWLAIADQRGDVLDYHPVVDDAYHGNTAYLERWQNLEDEEVKDAAKRLYDDAVSYRDSGGGGVEEGCAVFWSNRTVYEPDGTLRYQGLITADKQLEITFAKRSSNSKLTEGNSSYSLSGATYDIHRSDDDSIVASITTDDTGCASCFLKPNTSYYLVETAAPAGYLASSERIEFTTDTASKTVELADDPESFSLVIAKLDAATRDASQPGTSLEGAEYRLTSISTPGFELTGTTDKNGRLTFEGIPLGTATVTETKAPEGYALDDTAHTYTVHADEVGKDGTVEINPGLDFIEHPIAFDIELEKRIDAGDESDQKAPGVDVTFEIISNTTGEKVGSITTDSKGMASTEGMWLGSGERPEGIQGSIPYDRAGYTIHEVPETAPEGAQPAGDWTIGPDQMVDGTTLHFAVDNKMITALVSIVKTDASSGERIPLAGCSFTILDEDGQPLGADAWYPEAPASDTFTTDENGTVTLPARLRPGTYRVHEIEAPAPYLLRREDVTFEVSETGDSPTAVVEVPNSAATGQATIVKTCSADGEALAGAEFDIVAQQDIVTLTGETAAVAGQVLDHVTTDEEGHAQTEKLPLGSGTASYAFVETKPAPDHALDSAPIAFTLSYRDQQTATVTAEVEAINNPTGIDIIKTAADDAATPVEGAVFELVPADSENGDTENSDQSDNANGEEGEPESPETADEPDTEEEQDAPADEQRDDEQDNAGETPENENDSDEPTGEHQRCTTDANGKAHIDHIAPGSYLLTEIDAPDGYVTSDEAIAFTVDDAGLIDGKPSAQIAVTNDVTKVDISKRDAETEEELEGAVLAVFDDEGNQLDEWTTTTEPHRITKLTPGTYTLAELVAPSSYDTAASQEFTVEDTADPQTVVMYDGRISISGMVDKRQQIADPISDKDEPSGDNRAAVTISDEGLFNYAIDACNTSSTWVDEFTVTDDLTFATNLSDLVGITTPVATGDCDGLMNVWYLPKGNRDQEITSNANATLSSDTENPRLSDDEVAERIGDDGRAVDYTGWRLWKQGVSTTEATELSVADLDLEGTTVVSAIRFEFGRVEAGFTTRTDGWDRDDLKNEHDDYAGDIETDAEHAPALIHMKTQHCYGSGFTMTNKARVELYRNGGGEGLEALDEDEVRQTAVRISMPLAQTGVLFVVPALLATGGIGLGVALALRSERDRRIRWRP